MYLCYQYAEIDNLSGIFSIKINPSGNIAAYLSQEAVYIRIINEYKMPIKSTYFRDENSILTLGPNYWVQWITNNKLTFGTCNGVVFYAELDNNYQIVNVEEYDTELIVQSTFAKSSYLCICTVDMMVYKCQKGMDPVKLMQIEAPGTRFKDLEFFPPGAISCLCSNYHFLGYLSHSSMDNNAPFLKFVDTEHVFNKVAFNCYFNIVAGCSEHEIKIFRHGSKANDILHTIMIHSHVEFMKWVKRGIYLFVILKDGNGIIYHHSSHSVVNIKIPDIDNMIAYEFDRRDQLLLLSDFNTTKVLEFIGNVDAQFFTATYAYDFSGKLKFTVDESCSKLFPLRSCMKTKTGLYVLVSSNGFLVTDGDIRSDFMEINAINAGVVNDLIVIFTYCVSDNVSKGCKAVFYKYFNESGIKFIAERIVQHLPMFLQSHKANLIVGSPGEITTLIVTNDDDPNSETYIIDMEYRSQVETFKNFVFSNGTLFTLRENNNLTDSKSTVCENCDHFWCDDDLDVLFASYNNKTIAGHSNKYFEFAGRSLFSYQGVMYSLKNQINFGTISFSGVYYLSYFLQSLSNEMFSYHYNYSKGSSHLLLHFSDALLLSLTNNIHEDYHNQMTEFFTAEDYCTVSVNALLRLLPEQKTRFYCLDIMWNHIFTFMQPKEALFILKDVSVSTFKNNIEPLAKNAYIDSIIKLLIKYGKCVHAYIITQSINRCFADYLGEFDAKILFKVVSVDRKLWQPSEWSDYASKIAEIAEDKRKYRVAFAYYHSINDDREKLMAEKDPGIATIIREMSEKKGSAQ